ncbi:hypothetical protein BH762_gp004 [Gordonia phage OneUp]|uniref:Uncharacterized protein n=1 Tax=Gordonia phage OneUp TaxID=1838074 RepID=A0A166Y8T4_9CAUD|nr:hypothetical protein BH762_gp004 [Gordonia phage OneUp]ANA86347.1 hypothetical protein PBI_ONEUP_4 [Gordonia phage OneUp]
MSYVTLRIDFKDVTVDDEVYRRMCCARRVETDLTPKEIAELAEQLGDSDRWHGATFDLLHAMENEGPVEL